MSDSPEQAKSSNRFMLLLRTGGWVILLAVVLTACVLVWRVRAIVGVGGSRAIGDGWNVATYGFDLSPCLIPPEQIVAAGFPKDGIPALIDPPVIPGSQVAQRNRTRRGKYLVPGDRIIGVAIEGQSRAYPLRIVNWHEVVNDTLGGRPIAVTYSPLCDSVVVFDRGVGNEVVTFGVSGLLYNSNLLMYDRRSDTAKESLWSQLQFRAVAGPAGADRIRLTIIPASVVHWSRWLEKHPDTEVIEPDPRFRRRYKRNPYGHYYSSDHLHFPVRPLPPADTPLYKTPVVVVGADGVRQVFPLPAVAAKADAQGHWQTDIDAVPVRFIYRANPPTVEVELAYADSKRTLEVIHTFWFAWYATHPDDAVLAVK